jgi:hypothetical protein
MTEQDIYLNFMKFFPIPASFCIIEKQENGVVKYKSSPYPSVFLKIIETEENNGKKRLKESSRRLIGIAITYVN